MPVRKNDVSIAEQFSQASAKCLIAYNQLQSIIAFTTPYRGGSLSFSRISHSQPPWNSAVAFSFFEFHKLARQVEIRFRVQASLPIRDRGCSDINTRNALQAAEKITDKAGDSAVFAAIGDLDAWLRKARVVLGELEMPQRLPRLPGKKDPACPFCKHQSLRMFPLRGFICCVNPVCKDENDRKPKARMIFSNFTKQWELSWQDGILGIPVEDEPEEAVA